jgi:uncharacterized damage-inducible protein DinB
VGLPKWSVPQRFRATVLIERAPRGDLTLTGSIDRLRFPIGPFADPGALDNAQRAAAIASIGGLPERLRLAVAGLTQGQLDTPYRPGGWTVRQVVHHLPDSHLNSYVRFKLGLTEDEPTIRTYHEELWAELADSAADVEVSLVLLEALHRRWTILLRSVADSDWQRAILHPDMGKMRLDSVLAFYDWHGVHHTAHILELRQRNDW